MLPTHHAGLSVHVALPAPEALAEQGSDNGQSGAVDASHECGGEQGVQGGLCLVRLSDNPHQSVHLEPTEKKKDEK